jgi:hypothetical protein
MIEAVCFEQEHRYHFRVTERGIYVVCGFCKRSMSFGEFLERLSGKINPPLEICKTCGEIHVPYSFDVNAARI